ncbi:MAG: ketoacyl-ACP synthase III [Rhizobiales bacterium]|nr:ketoacyl-ACP synthase III [Hyphomicrobiales bacterium]
MTIVRSVALGCGSYLPERVVTNQELAATVETSDEWIVQRTGIRQRHIAAEGEVTSDLAIQAARAALANAHVDAQSIDLIVLATSTPDNTFPASAVSVQAGLGITRGAAFDMQAVCSGFVYALAVTDGMLRTGAYKRALVIGAETFSRILDWSDRTTCVLFGDGAGAVVLEAQQQPGSREDRGILTTHLRSDGRHKTKLYVDGGPSSTKTVVDDSAQRLGIAPEKVVTTVHQHGNTSAASIPLALNTAIKDGRIKKGDLVLFEAMGGGFTWGSALVRW